MRYDPAIHHRRTIRLQGYDYSQNGAYFITICVQNRLCLFGEIMDGTMRLSDPGRMIEKWYHRLEQKFPQIQCDEFVCMPNHIHFIMENVGADPCVRPDSGTQSIMENVGADPCVRPDSGTLCDVVQWFKTMTTNEYIRGVKQDGWSAFSGKLWQRNYWEHIIRNETDLNHIRNYIQNNPVEWELDRLNPNIGDEYDSRGEPVWSS
ncbi:MAG: transposase [SAR324 cluster bacterium]|nr:transposase [SAR324 cluster bacterium]